jgi:hypothetical protein
VKEDSLAWCIAIAGVSLEVFIATLDFWFPHIPHLMYEVGSGFRVVKK